MITTTFSAISHLTVTGHIRNWMIKQEKTPPPSTTAEKLEELKSLYKSELINQAEYETKKRDILNAM